MGLRLAMTFVAMVAVLDVVAAVIWLTQLSPGTVALPKFLSSPCSNFSPSPAASWLFQPSPHDPLSRSDC